MRRAVCRSRLLGFQLFCLYSRKHVLLEELRGGLLRDCLWPGFRQQGYRHLWLWRHNDVRRGDERLALCALAEIQIYAIAYELVCPIVVKIVVFVYRPHAVPDLRVYGLCLLWQLQLVQNLRH